MFNQQKLANLSIIALLLALLRTTAEPFRLQHYSAIPLSFQQVKPFLFAAVVIALGLLIICIAHFYKKYLLVTAIAALVIIIMLIIKSIYL